MYEISMAEPQDISLVYQMIQNLACTIGIQDKLRITESNLSEILLCKAPIHFAIVAKANTQVVGFALYNIMSNNICFNAGNGVYLENLYVDAEYRGLGIGSALFKQVMSNAKDSGCNRVEWWISKAQKDVMRFYERFDVKSLDEWLICKCENLSTVE
ncbi:N-acetyltransferase ats1 [Legionella geestiana]|uniref:N-acetyltransferase ats1 n=2 Tax=Legionella geestiana TaxID=45065 RepID=A0A0W0U6R4_9GAMM|nr:GNAT family N-acetyltransferase [Legionella geestiana]KTD03716.1 N-acetyltransferase ats1 [Legionella geestiana]QBS11517.1 GNAT family N-acetyltransferase [Legionella geestiana]STX53818.1 N-acetyltransferase ats1 [Legionella geestiana]